MSYNKLKTDFQVFLARMLARLPLPFLMGLGRLVGRLVYFLPNSRKRIAQINLELCFPSLGVSEASTLLKKTMISTGQGLTELLTSFWAKDSVLEGVFEIRGEKNLQQALEDGRGCLMLSCHTTSLEWGVRGLNQWAVKNNLPTGHILARQHNNKLLEAHLEQARLSYADKLIDKKNLRGLLSSIKSGHPVFYAPDQNFSYQAQFADFFGRPAATTTGTQKLAQKGVKVVPWFCFRTGPCKWRIEILPEMKELVSVSNKEASNQINQLFEQQIKQFPEQYLWVHRRFKNQPNGIENPYK